MKQKYLFILFWTLVIPSMFFKIVQSFLPVWIWKPYLVVTALLGIFLVLSYLNGYLKFKNQRLNKLTFWIKDQRQFEVV